MAGKLIAGIVCGGAGAMPAKHMLSTLVASLQVLISDKDQLELGLMISPFLMAGLVILLCWLAPTVLGAWFRGCLFVTVISIIAAFQVVQCFGIEWIVGETFNDPSVRDAAMASCNNDLTPSIALIYLAMGVAFGAATIMFWRRSMQSGLPDV